MAKKWKQYRKKYADLYNALWEIVHAEHKYVFAGNETHEQLVERLAAAIVASGAGTFGTHLCTPRDLVELVLTELFMIVETYDGEEERKVD